MKFCDEHWAKLRAGVQSRGLWHLVAESGEDAIQRMERELDDGKSSAASFDPLMGAHWAICGRAIAAGGLYLMTGDYCPLCELDAHATNEKPERGPLSEQWIEGCLDAQRKHAEALGLVPSDAGRTVTR